MKSFVGKRAARYLLAAMAFSFVAIDHSAAAICSIPDGEGSAFVLNNSSPETIYRGTDAVKYCVCRLGGLFTLRVSGGQPGTPPKAEEMYLLSDKDCTIIARQVVWIECNVEKGAKYDGCVSVRYQRQ